MDGRQQPERRAATRRYLSGYRTPSRRRAETGSDRGQGRERGVEPSPKTGQDSASQEADGRRE